MQETLLSNGDLLLHPEVSAGGQTYDCFVHLERDDVTVHYRSYLLDLEQGMVVKFSGCNVKLWLYK